ncbi:MAG: alpha/beta hydrolase [Legionellaceae bacterium]|nr:alpha/beta hydrolase [Legionellaceae bacterium]
MIKQFILIFSICLVIIFALLYLLQRNFIYFPDKQKPELYEYHATDMHEISVITKDRIKLNAWYKPSENGMPTILFLHGNAGHIGHRMPWARKFLDSGFGVLLLDYRGYGGNKGSPSEQGLFEDGRAALQFLNEHNIPSNKIVIYGESLGTAVATHLASENKVCSVILQSPFTSMTNLARHHYPWIWIKPWDKFNSLDKISAVRSPLYIAHGKHDEVVPFSDGLIVFKQANEPKKILKIDNGSHNNLWSGLLYDEIIMFLSDSC